MRGCRRLCFDFRRQKWHLMTSVSFLWGRWRSWQAMTVKAMSEPRNVNEIRCFLGIKITWGNDCLIWLKRLILSGVFLNVWHVGMGATITAGYQGRTGLVFLLGVALYLHLSLLTLFPTVWNCAPAATERHRLETCSICLESTQEHGAAICQDWKESLSHIMGLWEDCQFSYWGKLPYLDWSQANDPSAGFKVSSHM